jgi:hypothetical protein
MDHSPQFHKDHTSISLHFFILTVKTEQEVWFMFLGIQWYWWLMIAAAAAISIPFKIRFMKWWNKRQQEKKDSRLGKWGDDA